MVKPLAILADDSGRRSRAGEAMDLARALKALNVLYNMQAFTDEGGKDDDVKAFEPVLYRLSDRLVGSGLSCSKIGEGKSIPVSTLFSCGDDIALYDNGFEVWVWVGKGASPSERISAFPYAQKYLKDKSRPSSLPITREAEGKEGKVMRVMEVRARRR